MYTAYVKTYAIRKSLLFLTMGCDVPLFVIFPFSYIIQTYRLTIYCALVVHDDVGKRDDDGLKQACWVFAES
jgi:hypothetical protein